MAASDPVIAEEMEMVACSVKTFEKDRGVKPDYRAGCIRVRVTDWFFAASVSVG